MTNSCTTQLYRVTTRQAWHIRTSLTTGCGFLAVTMDERFAVSQALGLGDEDHDILAYLHDGSFDLYKSRPVGVESAERIATMFDRYAAAPEFNVNGDNCRYMATCLRKVLSQQYKSPHDSVRDAQERGEAAGKQMATGEKWEGRMLPADAEALRAAWGNITPSMHAAYQEAAASQEH